MLRKRLRRGSLQAVSDCRGKALSKQKPPSSSKDWLATFLLCWFLGVFGAHRFYVGKTGSAIAMILTLGGLGIWNFIDWIVILCGEFKDKDGRVIKRK